MKFCPKCGSKLLDEAGFCANCGCSMQNSAILQQQSQGVVSQASGLVTAAKIFLIIGTVLIALYTFLIGLAWCIPMTLSYFKKVKRGEPVSVGFKVCSLLFVSGIAGILMLCDKEH